MCWFNFESCVVLVVFNVIFLVRLFLLLCRHSEYLKFFREYVARNEFVQWGTHAFEARRSSWSRRSRQSTRDVELSNFTVDNPYQVDVARTTTAPTGSIGARNVDENPATDT